MSRVLYFLIATYFVLAYSTAAFADPKQCTKIENDIARLQCYDGIFLTDQADISVADAFSALKQIAEFRGSNDFMLMSNKSCVLTVHTLKDVKYDDYTRKTFYKLALAEIPVGSLDIEKTKSSRKGLGWGREAVLMRGSTGKFFGDYMNGTAKLQTMSQKIEVVPDERMAKSFALLGAHLAEEFREIPLIIFHPAYRSDREEIFQAFLTYAEACSREAR